MTRTSLHILALLALLGIGGCASPPSNFYRLTPIEGGNSTHTSTRQVVVMLRPIVVSEAANKPMLVVQTGPGSYRLEEQERWVEPLSDGVERALRSDLGMLSPSVTYIGDDVDQGPVNYVLNIDIDNLEGALNGHAAIDARYYLTNKNGELCTSHTFHWETSVGSSYDALVMAYSQGLSALAQQISADVPPLLTCTFHSKESPL